MNYDAMNDNYISGQLKLVKLSVMGAKKERADRLCAYFEGLVGATLLRCDLCGGVSTDAMDSCPYCGDGGTKNPVPITNKINGPVEDLKIYDEGDLDRLIDRMWREIQRQGNVRNIGLILQNIRERKLWKLRLTRKGKQKYCRYRDWLLQETPFLRATAMRMIRIAKADEKTWSEIYPNFLMCCASKGFKDLFPRNPEEKPKFKPIVKIDDRLGRVIEILPIETDGKETITIEREDGSIEHSRVDTSAFVRRTAPRFRPIKNPGVFKISLNLGYARLPLLRRRDNDPARDFSDDPYCSMQLSPEIRLEIRLIRNQKGEMEVICETKRI
jgi:hypothetical protein